MIRQLIALILMPFAVSCAYSIHQVQLSDFTPYAPLEKNGEVISAKSEQFVILGFASETKYVDQAYQSLQSKCLNGEISSISTEYYTDLGFYSWTNRIMMQGICRGGVSKN